MVTVGTTGSRAHYTLPVKLLNAHSSFFAAEIQRLVSAASSKKRKIAPDSDAKPAATVIDVESHHDHTASLSLAISVPDVEPAIFGLFLVFMYTGCYPSSVDMASAPRSSAALTTAYKFPYSDTAPLNTPPEVIPASVCAWLLAHRLGSPPFMNQAMLRIYKGLSFYFTLTPALTEYIWSNTTASVPSIAGQSAEAPHVAASDRNPLRKFILDILTTYWSVPSTTSIIAKTGLGVEWTRVFDVHPDLRQHFILGMQGDKRVGPATEYFVATQPNLVVVGEKEALIKQEPLDTNRTPKEKGMDVASEKLSVACRTTPPKTD